MRTAHPDGEGRSGPSPRTCRWRRRQQRPAGPVQRCTRQPLERRNCCSFRSSASRMWPSKTRWWWPLRHFLVEVCCIGAMLVAGGNSVLFADRFGTSSPPHHGKGRCPEVDACSSLATLFLVISIGASTIAAASAGCVLVAMLCARWRHGEIGVAAYYRVLYWFGAWLGVLLQVLLIIVVVVHAIFTDPPHENSVVNVVGGGSAALPAAGASSNASARRALVEVAPDTGDCGTLPDAVAGTPTGCCAGNFDNRREPDFSCPQPKYLKPDARRLRGYSEEICCDCTEDPLDMVVAYCVDSQDQDPEADNVCTAIMKYANCGTDDQIQSCVELAARSSTSAEAESCNVCMEAGPAFDSWWNMADSDAIRAQTVCMGATTYGCSYIFRRAEYAESCIEGRCEGNTVADANGVPTQPDIVCPEPKVLIDGMVGRDQESCCVASGMCASNTDTELEPD
eukprot:COSAG02_NODE_5992_length_3885_cov_34.568938_3_plen_452_part_01